MTIKGINIQTAKTGEASCSLHEFLLAQNLSVRITRLLHEVLKGPSEKVLEGMLTEEMSIVPYVMKKW